MLFQKLIHAFPQLLNISCSDPTEFCIWILCWKSSFHPRWKI